jgi:hypothetical protein
MLLFLAPCFDFLGDRITFLTVFGTLKDLEIPGNVKTAYGFALERLNVVYLVRPTANQRHDLGKLIDALDLR